MIELIFFFKFLSIIFLPLYDWNMSDTAYSTIQSYPLKGEPSSEIRVSGIPCRAKWPTRWPMIAPLVAVDAHLQRNASNSLLQSSSPCSDIQISHKQGLRHSVAFSLSLVRLNYLPLAMLDQYKLLRALLILPWIPMWELWILSSKLLRFAVWTFPFVD